MEALEREVTIRMHDPNESLTKRKILSNIAAIDDPLQWLALTTIGMEILMQKMWQSEVGWDNLPPEDILAE